VGHSCSVRNGRHSNDDHCLLAAGAVSHAWPPPSTVRQLALSFKAKRQPIVMSLSRDAEKRLASHPSSPSMHIRWPAVGWVRQITCAARAHCMHACVTLCHGSERGAACAPLDSIMPCCGWAQRNIGRDPYPYLSYYTRTNVHASPHLQPPPLQDDAKCLPASHLHAILGPDAVHGVGGLQHRLVPVGRTCTRG
jgi:hypothetical protein